MKGKEHMFTVQSRAASPRLRVLIVSAALGLGAMSALIVAGCTSDRETHAPGPSAGAPAPRGSANAAPSPSPQRPQAEEPPHVHAASDVAAGRYLVRVGGCNDCHTPGWEMAPGAIPEDKWLVGQPVGFRGPWGTTYPSNLRLSVKEASEDVWVTTMRARTTRPPMPWHALQAMSDGDLRSVYRYIASLGPAGEKAPEYVEPNREPKTPFFLFVPQPPK